MSEEVIILKDLKQVSDKYYNYTQTLKNEKTPIIIDNGKYFSLKTICTIIISDLFIRFVYL